MKKLLIVCAIIIGTMVACINNTPPIWLIPPQEEAELPSDIYVPVFYDGASSSLLTARGIVDMTPEGSPFEGMFEAGSIMRTMPVMVSLNHISNNGGNALASISDRSRAFGFPVRFDRENSRINNDGAYLRYDILSEQEDWSDDVIGRIDYYYNDKDYSFSYRQVLALNINYADVCAADIYSPAVLVIEYTDVPIRGVESNGRVSFNTAVIGRNGEIEPKVTMDMIQLGMVSFGSDSIKYIPDWFAFDRITPVISSEDGRYMVMNMPYYSMKYLKDDGYPERLKELVIQAAGSDMTFDREESRNMDIDFVLDVLDFIYGHPYKHDTYHSAGNFSSDSLSDIKGIKTYLASDIDYSNLVGEGRTTVWGSVPAIFDFNSGETGTPSKITGAIGNEGFEVFYNEEYYNASGMEKFLGDIDFTDGEEGRDSIIAEFMKEMGITDSNYIANYIISVDQSLRQTKAGIQGGGRYILWTSVPVNSIDDPDVFRAKLDAEYARIDSNGENRDLTGGLL